MTRVISGVFLAAAALAAILFLPLIGLRLLACAVAALAAHEYVHVVSGGRSTRGEVPALLIVALTCWWMAEPVPAHLVVLVLFGVVWVGVEVLLRARPIGDAAARFFAPWYLGMPLGMLVSVQMLGGRTATLLLMATVVVSDSAQYYSGRMFGRHPLAPAISPKKTIEGAVGGVIVGTLFMALAGQRVLPGRSITSLAGLGLAIVVLGIGGDLFESRLKRAAGLKDSSSLIPGHGGVLDRIDALLFAVPPFYVYLHGSGGL